MKHTTNRTLIFALLMLLSAWPALGATYHVKAGGNDSLDGLSDETAWATISKVDRTAIRGDTVYFRSQDTWSASSGGAVLKATAGVTYDGSTYGSGTRATLQATGELEAMVEIYVGDVTFRGFNVDGNAQVTGGIYVGTHAPTSISNVTVDNCVVHDNGGPESIPTKYYYGIHVGSVMPSPTTVSNVTLTNTTVYNAGHEGIAVYPTWLYPNNKVDGLLIRNCIVHDSAHWGGIAWGDGISITNEADNVTVEFSSSYNNFRGITVATSAVHTGSPHNLTVRYSIIHDNTVAGIIFLCPSGIAGDGSFYSNLLHNDGKHWQQEYAADILMSGGYDFTTSTFSFYNNTIYSTINEAAAYRYAVWIGAWGPIEGIPTINFKNNIVYTGSYTAIRDDYNTLTHSNNLIYRSSGASDEHVYNGASLNRAGVLTWELSARNTNPSFVGGTLPAGFAGTYGTDMQPDTSFFAITSGAALRHGATLGSPCNGCINGAGLSTPVVRPQGAYDIGAYQKSRTPLPRP